MSNEINFTLDYDEKFDVLYVNFNPDGSSCYGCEIDKVVYMKDIETEECKGLMIDEFNKYLNSYRIMNLLAIVPSSITFTRIIREFMHKYEKKYTLVFLYNKTKDKVLLMYKTKGPYLNKYNGVGGKLEHDECPLNGAIREVKEETGVNLYNRIRYLDQYCPTNYIHLHIFYGIVDENEVQQKEEEAIQWFSLNEVDAMKNVLVPDVLKYLKLINDLL